MECPACGIIYSKYRGDAPGAPPPPPPVTPGEDVFNPYAPPESDLAGPAAGDAPDGEGIWRSGSLLVMEKGARLPNRCIRCNQPASTRLSRKLSWHRPLIYLTLVIHLFVYLIIALIARKRARIEVPLCDEHARKRRWAVGISVTMLVLSVVFAGLAIVDDQVGLFVSLWWVILLFIILTAVSARTVAPKKIDDHHIWLKKISPAYLSAFPTAPRTLAEP
jgi:hypothetical protein